MKTPFTNIFKKSYDTLFDSIVEAIKYYVSQAITDENSFKLKVDIESSREDHDAVFGYSNKYFNYILVKGTEIDFIIDGDYKADIVIPLNDLFFDEVLKVLEELEKGNFEIVKK